MENSKQNQDERARKFRQMSNEPMGNTHVKYCSHIFQKLGRGLSATVYPGYHHGISKPTAVKFIEKEYVRRATKKDEQMKELLIWTKIDENFNIIRLYDSYNDPKYGMFLAMELAERTFKCQILKFSQTEDQVIKWLYQITSAVEYLHGKGVIHRDIKPDNILMTLQDENRLVAKLADFGVSKMLSSAAITSTFSNANGTLLWMAPEALENQHEKFKNTRMLDIYALGMTMYFGLSKGGHPFAQTENEDVIIKVVPRMQSSNTEPNILGSSNIAANVLLKRMMKRRPEDRPEILEVLSHCLFWDWKDELLFLIRTAICLSIQSCPEIESIKNQIEAEYIGHYQKVNNGKIFNWIEIANENDFDMKELLFTSLKRTKPTVVYGKGESVMKFLKLFRDKYVHYTDMKSEAVDKFSENDKSFREEKYVSLFTSICPGLVATLYDFLERYANEQNVLPLSKLYFPWKFGKDSERRCELRQVPLTRADVEKEERDSLEAYQNDLPVDAGFKTCGTSLGETLLEGKTKDESVPVPENLAQKKPAVTIRTQSRTESRITQSLKQDDEEFNLEALRRLREKDGREFTLGKF